ncbi:MAG: SRPBCC domain-containing protein [Chloroflexi bacterium]|nr:SRPBCC domain-containing protein [Chloroflexota bacterium]
MSTSQPVIVQVSRRYSQPAERVFDAWLDPAKAGRFLFATPTGRMVRVEIDPRVGGKYAFVERRDGVDVAHTGEYLQIQRPHRLIFTFSVEGSAPDRVTVEIAPLENGCELTLTHEMKPEWAEYAGRTQEGWGMILEGLAQALG